MLETGQHLVLVEGDVDSAQFDDLSRRLGQLQSRRGALVSLLSGGVSLLGARTTLAKHHNGGHKHKTKHVDPAPPPPPTAPPGPPAPTGCPQGTHDCGGTCVDLSTNPQHCAFCDHVCASGSCQHGACICDNDVDDFCAPCSCIITQSATFVCYDGDDFGSCQRDEDCPIGSACQFNNRCSGQCNV